MGVKKVWRLFRALVCLKTKNESYHGHGLELIFGDFKYLFILTEYLSEQDAMSPDLSVELCEVSGEPSLVFALPRWFLWFRVGNRKVVFQEPVIRDVLQELLNKYGDGFQPEFGNFKSWSGI